VFVNPFDAPGKWYKANLHTHTKASDGQASLDERIEQYRGQGYSVLAITDHGVPSDVARRSTRDLLLVDGIEVEVKLPGTGRFYHLVCLNIRPDGTAAAAAEPADIIAWAKHQGGETLIAHPYWSGNNAYDLVQLEGHIGIEVYNGGCTAIGKASSSVHWDDLLDMGARLPALAVDDVHSASPGGRDLFGGWIMLKMKELTTRALLEALRTGCYYSSSGVEILDFQLRDGKACVRCSPAREIHLMAANWHGRSFYAEGNAGITEAEADVSNDWRYVRAEVVGTAGCRAWSNPIYL